MSTVNGISVAELVDEVGSLPAVAARIVALTSDPECDMGELADAILVDGAMTMRFLALANSAAFSRGQEVRDLRTSLVRLGLKRVRDLALLMGAHDLFPPTDDIPGLNAAAYWRHNLATACWARQLAHGLADGAEYAWLAGILHGIGVAALVRKAPGELAAAVDLAQRRYLTLAAAELAVCGWHHGQVGAAICERWRLPRLLRDVVAHHSATAADPPPPADAEPLVLVIRQARELARAQGLGISGDGTSPLPLEHAGQAAGLTEQRLASLAETVAHEVAGIARSLTGEREDPSPEQSLVRAREPLARLGLEGADASLARKDLQDQLDTARQIQRRLLPESLQVPGPWTVAADNRPSLTVSGDIFDVFPAANDSTAVVVADVCGKGVAAALLAANLQATLRALAPVVVDPGELVAQANTQLFAATGDEDFATLFLLLLPRDGSAVTVVSAGHVPPLWRRAAGDNEWLVPGGPPVGMMPRTTYQSRSVELGPGDQVVVCTDGVVEAADDRADEFGRDRLQAAVATDPATTLARVLEAVADHAGIGTPGDDLTVLVVSRDS